MDKIKHYNEWASQARYDLDTAGAMWESGRYIYCIFNEVSVPTRYPDELEKLLKEYSRDKTQLVLRQSEEVLKWLTERLEK